MKKLASTMSREDFKISNYGLLLAFLKHHAKLKFCFSLAVSSPPSIQLASCYIKGEAWVLDKKDGVVVDVGLAVLDALNVRTHSSVALLARHGKCDAVAP
jgi:hypothetical protein